MSQLLYDADSGTTLPFDPSRIFVVDVEDAPELAERLDSEDRDAQRLAEATSPTLENLISSEPIPETITVYPNRIQFGDVIVEGNHRMLVENNDGPSSTIPGTTRIENPFGTLYLDDELTVEVIREDGPSRVSPESGW